VKQLRTRCFRTRKGDNILAAVLDQKANEEDLDATTLVTLLARRDLIFLQRLFRDLDKIKGLRITDYRTFKRRVTKALDALTKQDGPPNPR